MMKKKEVIEALTAIKGYCDEHYCGDCCIRYICDNNFSGFPDEVRDTERGESGFGSTGK